MPNTKEKLIELINQAKSRCRKTDCQECDYYPLFGMCKEDMVADHLIANGVMVQDVPNTEIGRWIPVTEELPKLIPCSAGTGYSEAVNVLTEGRKVLTAIWDGTDFITDADFWDAEGERITHWTPVPLPLPEPMVER